MTRTPLAQILGATALGALLLTACAPAPQPEAPAAAPEAAAPAAVEAPAAAPAQPADPLDAAIAGSWRTPDNVARDGARHPAETLRFFGITPTQTVIEITPGGGWYTEILAPYLKDGGRYVGAIIDPSKQANERSRDYYAKSNEGLRTLLAGAPEAYGRAELVEFDVAAPVLGPAGSADLVLTFRNVHNWRGNGHAEGLFKAFFDVLKPGGVLGVVEHRAAADVPADDRSGYVSEAQVTALATAAGFVLEASSEINANPLDTKNHPNGVWTLPPSLRVPEGTDPEAFRAIGESDRMTLKFRKPADAAPPAAASAQ